MDKCSLFPNLPSHYHVVPLFLTVKNDRLGGYLVEVYGKRYSLDARDTVVNCGRLRSVNSFKYCPLKS